MIKYLPFLVYKENGRKKPVYYIEWEISVDNPFYKEIHCTSKHNTMAGLFVAELKNEKNDGEPIRVEDVKFWRKLDGWSPESMVVDEGKYRQHLSSLDYLPKVQSGELLNKK